VIRILIVPPNEQEDANRLFRRGLASSNVTLFAVDFTHPPQLIPKTECGKAYGAEACVVGLAPKIVRQLCAQYQLQLRPDETLNGTVKQNQKRIETWLQTGAPERPQPTFTEIVQNAVADCPGIVLAKRALDQADGVSSSAEDGADGFPDFLSEAVRALGRLAETTGGLVGETLAEYFAREAPLAEYASSGGEAFSYQDASGSASRRKSKMHLKPKSERRGYHNRSIKPRLYFDIVTCDGDKRVALLYFGPHPPENRTGDVGEIPFPPRKHSP